MFGAVAVERAVVANLELVGRLLATFRRKIGVFGIAVKGADKAKPAQGGGRGVKISDGLLHAAREQLAFPLRGQC